MAAKNHRYALAPSMGHAGRAVKRSITVRPDIDTALLEVVAEGDTSYSQVANYAFIVYLQARGIDNIVATGPIPRSVKLEGDRRL